MATLEELARQIAAAEDLQAVVRTMKATSAASIRQHEAAERAMRDYLATVELGLGVVLRALPPLPPAGGESLVAGGRVAVVLIGSEIGLCGSFNERLADHAGQALARQRIAPDRRLVLTIGSSFATSWQAAAGQITAHHPAPATLEALSGSVARVLRQLDRWGGADGLERIMLFHQRPGPVFQAVPAQVDLHPLDPDWLARIRAAPWPSRRLPQIIGPAIAALGDVVQQLLFARLHAAMVQSRTAEHAERLAAMQAADRSIAEKLDELRATHHQRRQAAISMELLDLIAGFEAATATERAADQSAPVPG